MSAWDKLAEEAAREDVSRLERTGAYGQPFPGEPKREIEDDWFTYARAAQPVILGDEEE